MQVVRAENQPGPRADPGAPDFPVPLAPPPPTRAAPSGGARPQSQPQTNPLCLSPHQRARRNDQSGFQSQTHPLTFCGEKIHCVSLWLPVVVACSWENSFCAFVLRVYGHYGGVRFPWNRRTQEPGHWRLFRYTSDAPTSAKGSCMAKPAHVLGVRLSASRSSQHGEHVTHNKTGTRVHCGCETKPVDQEGLEWGGGSRMWTEGHNPKGVHFQPCVQTQFLRVQCHFWR